MEADVITTKLTLDMSLYNIASSYFIKKVIFDDFSTSLQKYVFISFKAKFLWVYVCTNLLYKCKCTFSKQITFFDFVLARFR